MSQLTDQAARDLFIQEREKNFSLLAPAGVGKTYTIVQRLVEIARGPRAEEVLPRLVVVTFSVKAALEMQTRARLALAGMKVTATVRRAFQQIYFGTIHSYCVRLLERFGSHLGLAAPVQLMEEEDEIWQQFLRHGFPTLSVEDEKATQILFALYPARQLFLLGQILTPDPGPEYVPVPNLKMDPLLAYETTSKGQTRLSIERRQRALRIWWEAWRKAKWKSPPELKSCKDEAFQTLWDQSFAPLRTWLQSTAETLGRKISQRYEAFRMREGVMTYDDQLRWAAQLLARPEVAEQIGSEKISVILDEAQDTSPLQFEILRLLVGLSAHPGARGTLSLVGDFQQLIYDSVDEPRAEASVYQRLHQHLSTAPHGLESTLRVTFRCDQAIVSWVNETFPVVLTGQEEQVSFVPLTARDEAGPGQVVRWAAPVPENLAKKEAVQAQTEAAFLAHKLKETGLAGLGVISWREVALLCPRNAWLAELAQELRLAGLPVQLHSTHQKMGSLVAVRWLTALVWVAAHPEDSFEVTGILRDLYGLSDPSIALFTQGQGSRLRLDRAGAGAEGEVAEVVNELRMLMQEAVHLPLHQSVRWLAEKTNLAARVVSLPQEDPAETAEQIETIFQLATEQAAAGGTLAELADELRQRLGQALPGEETIRDAIQLVSGHKAKGLEWPVVVVPYLYRAIKFQSPRYPRYRRFGETWRVMLDEQDQTETEKIGVERQRQQSLARLLYVLATRAKKTLLLVDDEALWQKTNRGFSLAEIWQLSGKNQISWQALPTTLWEKKEIPQPPPKPQVPALPKLTVQSQEQARLRAQEIPRRLTPHALARRDDPDPSQLLEDRPEVAPDNAAILYGTWWHELMEQMEWSRPRDHWQETFLHKIKLSPQKERAKSEWDLFLRSELAAWLSQPNRVVHQEWPFLYPIAPSSVMEGVMDLVVLIPEEHKWQVIDWKTNRLPKGGAAGLIELYRGQIEAYVRALGDMTGQEVRGSLYLTVTGQWLEV